MSKVSEIAGATKNSIPSSRMAFGQTLWMLISYLSIFIPLMLLARAIYYNCTRTHIPPGIKDRKILWCATFLSGILFGLALFLEKLGICHRYKIWRIMLDGIELREHPYLIIKDLVFEEVPVRIYWPRTPSTSKRRGILYLHGGIGLVGSIQAYERVCRYFALNMDSVVVSVGFRLAPEYPSPAAILDCCTAAIHFLKNAEEYGVDPNRILIAGDSSGGTFAATICQRLVTRKDLPRLRGQILFYPFLQAVDFNLPSYQQNHSVPSLFKKRAIKHGFYYYTGTTSGIDGIMKNAHVPEHLWVKYRKWISADNIPEEFKVRGYVLPVPAPFSEQLYETCKAAFDPMFSPLLAEDDIIRQLPETYIYTCEYDIVRDDGLLYKKRLEDNGVSVTWLHVKDGYHGTLFTIGLGAFEFSGLRSTLKHLKNFIESV